MGEEKWTRRKPGSASGTVVPPPAADDEIAQSPAPPVLPESVRSLFKPVLTEPAIQAGQQPASGRRRGLGPGWLAGAAAAVLIVAVGTTIALLPRHAPAVPAGGAGTRTGHNVPPGMSRAAQTRMAAARWVVREIGGSAIIGCDTVMCATLERAGRPAPDLLMVGPSRPDPLGVDVLIATPVLRSQFGSRLSTEYAPVVLARFGNGQAEIDVRVIAPEGATAYELALGRDIAARRSDGRALLGNPRIAVSPRARIELAAGDVDPRLLITLPAMAAQHAIAIIGFYDQAPRSSAGVPLSGVRLASDGGSPPGGYHRWLVRFLHAQQPQFRPLSVATTRNGRQVVSVRYPRPSPLGLLPS